MRHSPTARSVLHGAFVSLCLVLGVLGAAPAALAQDEQPPPPATKAPPGYPPTYPPSYRPGYPPGYPPIGTKGPATRPPGRRPGDDGGDAGNDSGSEPANPPPAKRPPSAGRPPAGDSGTSGTDGTGPGQPSEFETGIDFRRPSGLVTFNFEDADLPDLVRTITAITGRSFIIGGKVRSIKATIYSPSKVRPAEAYRAFLSALDANGLTVVPAGRYLKIIESSGSSATPLPVYREGEVVPAEERMVTRLHRLSHVSAEDISEVLGRFKSRDGDVTVYAPTNTLILTDTGANVRRLLQLVEELDVAASGEQIWVEPVHHAAASDLAEKLLEIFEAAGGTGPTKARAGARRPPTKAGGTAGAPASSGPATVGTGQAESRLSKIIPDDRTNSLIIVATERAYLRILELIRRLDVPLAGEGEIHVEYLQNADAEELAGVIQSIVGGGRGGGGAARRRQGGASGSGSGSSGSSAPGAATEADVFEGSVQVVADKATNSLVILSSLRDYTALRAVIQRLDIPRRQVFVEAALMEVSQSRLNTLGISLHGGLPVDVAVDGTTGDPAIGFTGTAYPAGGLPFSSVAIDPTALTGLAAGLLGPQIEGSEQVIGFSLPAFGVVLQALQSDNDVNVISTPHILATDNVEAQITVGQNVPVQQGFAGLGNLAGQAGQAGAGLAGLLPQVNVQRQNVGLTLKLTPHVNESQQVRLELNVELSEVQGAGGINPVISQRTANTQVVVRDQQTIVIGGLVRDVEAETEDKVPILGDIPVLGYLFRRTQTRREKQNLLIILTPYIIRDASDLRAIFQRKLEERREFIERYTAFANREPNLHIDYRRTNGLLEEINQASQEAEMEEQLLRDAAARVPPEHTPGQPIEMPRSSSGGGGGDDSEPDEDSDAGIPEPPTIETGSESGGE